MKTVYLLISSMFSILLFGQEHVLLRIGDNGRQEAMPIRPGEKISDVIQRLNRQRGNFDHPQFLIDTIKNYHQESDLTTNFGFGRQDVALQWFLPSADGVVKEFWWRNYRLRGALNKGNIRAWYVNPKLLTLPQLIVDGRGKMGYYKDDDDDFGKKTPFKDEATSQWWYKYSTADTIYHGFDPLESEAAWKPKGITVELDSNQWQGIAINQTGDSMKFSIGQPFGFTLMNTAQAMDDDVRMELLSTQSSYPYHSLKFYETTFTGEKYGWQLRSYDWGMYAVVEYTGDRPPVTKRHYIPSWVIIQPAKFSFIITDDNPSGGPSGVKDAYFIYRIGENNTERDSIPMALENSLYTVTPPTIESVDDTIYWQVTATDINGNRSMTTVGKLGKYAPKKNRLMLNNQSVIPPAVVFPHEPLPYDQWITKRDGIDQLEQLLSMYSILHIIDGDAPVHNIYPSVSQWLSSGTTQSKKHLFFHSQNYGRAISSVSSDTAFSAGMWEYDFLGISRLGPQNLPPPDKEFRMIPQNNAVTEYLMKYESDSNATLWYYPTFELGFDGSPDALELRPEASALFVSGAGKPMGVIHKGDKFSAVFLAFDETGLQFRSDTALSPGSDPSYHWIGDVKFVSTSFFESISVINHQPIGNPGTFSLHQNYPNPFNPTTTITFSIGRRENVTLTLYNTLGQKVRTLVQEEKEPGEYSVKLDASALSSGIYFYALQAGGFSSVKKMILMR